VVILLVMIVFALAPLGVVFALLAGLGPSQLASSGAWIAALATLGPLSALLTINVWGWRRFRAAMLRYNAAYEAMTGGQLERAEAECVALATTFQFELITVLAIRSLGAMALRRGLFDDAIVLMEAALARERRRILGVGNWEEQLRIDAAFANACAQRLDDAERHLGRIRLKRVHGPARVALVRTHAYAMWKRGDAAGVRATLQSSSALLANGLIGNDVALVAALRLVAGGSPDARVPVDAETRAFLVRALPESEPVLVDG
jgi:hypothetical protein